MTAHPERTRHPASAGVRRWPVVAAGDGGGRSFWDTSERWWHVVWLGVIAVVAFVVVTAAGPARDRWTGLGALALLVALYLLVGARLVGRDRDRAASLYLVGVVAGLLVLQAAWSPSLVSPLLFALFPQIWVLLSRRFAVVAVVVVPLVLATARAQQQGWGVGVARDVFVEAVAQFAIALILGLWVSGVVRESTQRAALLAELVATREELASAERARGVLAERERVAREIHDTLAQGFTSVVTLAQATAALLGDPDDPRPLDRALVRARLELMEETARTNLAEARGIVEALRPIDLRPDDAHRDDAHPDGAHRDDAHRTGPPPGDRRPHDSVTGDRRPGDLAAALGRVSARFTAETGVAVVLSGADDLPALAPDTEVVLLRAVQEGLSNVRRHAEAGRVEVVVAAGTGPDGVEEVALRIVDDGRGPGAVAGGPAPADGGYGLDAMASRLREVGGRVRLVAGDGGGAVLHVRVPR